MSSEYEQLKRRLDASIYKEEVKQKILRAKRAEKRAIKKGGGGHAIARAIMPNTGPDNSDTDFSFGHNSTSEQSSDGQGQTEGCMGRVVCTICKKFHGYCREVSEEKEKLKMLPTGDNNESSRNRSRTGGLNFLNAQDLSTSKQEAKVLMVRYTEKGKSGPSITLKLAFKGEIRYLWVPARKSDPRYNVMLNAFGPDENNWVDERIELYLERDEFSENYKQSISIPEKSASSSTRSRGSAKS